MNGKTEARRNRGARTLAVSAVLSLGLLLLPGFALAQTAVQRATTLTLTAPESVPVGNHARLIAVLRDVAGSPVPEARIIFTSPATFGGTTGEMAIGEAWTDAKGVATLDYQLRTQGGNDFVARFYGDGTHLPAEAGAVVSGTGLVQLTQRTAGVHLPVLGAWTIIAVLCAVWSVYFLGMRQVLRIPEGQNAQSRHRTGGHP